MANFNFSQAMYYISISLLPIWLGMTLHELAHGWVAYKMGDPTAKLAGRLTFNPLAQLDPMGSLFFIITATLSSATGSMFIFGWAKPVPIQPRLFRNIRKGLFCVSIAGAAANLLLALAFGLVLRILFSFYTLPANGSIMGHFFWIDVCNVGIWINITLAAFNLLPIPPLDGSKVLASLLPPKLVTLLFSIERYGMLIILLLLVTDILPIILGPIVDTLATLIINLVTLF